MNGKLFRLTLNQLLLSNVYLGTKSNFFNVRVKPFLLGSRTGSYIINLSFTYLQFKILINLIINIVSYRQKILIVKDLDFYDLKASLLLKNVFYYDKKWIGGILTNYRTVRKSLKFKENNLLAIRYMPSLLFLFNTNISKWALFEAYNLEIPVSAIIDTNSSYLEYINYPIIGNNQSFESIYLYVHILRNAVLKGRQKECLKIMRIV